HSSALAPRLIFALENELVGVGRVLALNQVLLVELNKQLDDFILCRSVISELIEDAVPNPLDVMTAITAADELIGGLVDHVLPTGCIIREHVPALPAPVLAFDPDVRLQLRMQVSDPIPVRAEQ